MADHIVRRGVGGSATRSMVEPRPTTKLSKDDLLGLMREGVHDELEPELEIVDALSPGLASSSQRFAHTLRRKPLFNDTPTTLMPPLARDERGDVATIAMPRLERAAGSSGTVPRIESPAGSQAAVASTASPAESASAMRRARPVGSVAAIPPLERPAPTNRTTVVLDPELAAGWKRPYAPSRGRARMVLPIALLVIVVGEMAYLLLRVI